MARFAMLSCAPGGDCRHSPRDLRLAAFSSLMVCGALSACAERSSFAAGNNLDVVPASSETPPATPVSETRSASGPTLAVATRAEVSAPDPDQAPRVYAKSRFVWVRSEPTSEVQWIGYLWAGGSVKVRAPRPIAGPGCASYYAVEPTGYVCADGDRATLDANDPAYQAILAHAPKLDSAWPHRYAESNGTPRYRALRNGATPLAFPALPSAIHEPRARLIPRSTIAYSTEVEHEDRAYLLSADFLWMPKESTVPYPVVTFQGVHLGQDAELPLAFFRTDDVAAFRRTSSGAVESTNERFARLSHVELTGKRFEVDETVYVETKLGGLLVRAEDAVLPTPREKTPWGVPVASGHPTGGAPEGSGTWLEVSVWEGWLLAYRGTRPVFATLISPGRGGTPVKGIPAIDTASTPVGTFPITGKFATATMVAPNELVHSDVPWTQNFSGPHALHGAYWHNDWGNLKSGGCINVSPLDGRFLYEFTEPRVPEGWHAVRWLPNKGPATILVVHE